MGRKKRFECDCPVCGAFFNISLAPFDDEYVTCSLCGTEVLVSLSSVPGDEPDVDIVDNEITEEDAWADPVNNMPQCCVACGGPFPQCTTSCKIFDD